MRSKSQHLVPHDCPRLFNLLVINNSLCRLWRPSNLLIILWNTCFRIVMMLASSWNIFIQILVLVSLFIFGKFHVVTLSFWLFHKFFLNPRADLELPCFSCGRQIVMFWVKLIIYFYYISKYVVKITTFVFRKKCHYVG